MPSALIAAITCVIVAAAVDRAALTEGWVEVNPTFTRATSGTTVTLPVPVTVIVCVAGSDAVGAAATGPLCTERAATATTSAPIAESPIERMRSFMEHHPGCSRRDAGGGWPRDER